MEPLTALSLARFALLGISILRGLELTGSVLYYKEFANVIGLLSPDAPWNIRYRKPITDVLDTMSAIALRAGESLDFTHLVSTHSGERSVGFHKQSRIVKT